MCNERLPISKSAILRAQEKESSKGKELFGRSFKSVHLPDNLLRRQSSSELTEYWTGAQRTKDSILPEYHKAFDSIIVSEEIMGTSITGKILQELEVILDTKPLKYSWSQDLCAAIRKGWPHLKNDTQVKDQLTDITEIDRGHRVHEGCTRLYNDISVRQKRALHAAIREHTESETSSPDDLRMILSFCVYGAHRCSAAKAHAFSTVIERVPLNTQSTEGVASTKQSKEENILAIARSHVRDAIARFVETVKSRALSTTFLEPSKLYYESRGDETGVGDVDVHSANYYCAVLSATLGIRFPRIIHFSDSQTNGLVSFLDRGKNASVANLWDPENFGKSYQSSIRKHGRIRDTHVVRFRSFVVDRMYHPKDLANALVDVSKEAQTFRKGLKPYLEQFASYFSEDFLLERLIGHVIRDDALKKNLEVIWRSCGGDDGETDGVQYWLYDDEYKLRKDRATQLLRCVGGVLKGPQIDRLSRATKESTEKDRPASKDDAAARMKSDDTRREEIESDLQRARASRDAAAIRRLMKERDKISSRKKMNTKSTSASSMR